MITLAFAQMIYFFCESLSQFGGDNGLAIPTHSDFGRLIDLDDPATLYYFALAFLVAALLLGNRLVDSRFGMVIRAAKSNERRMEALGFPVFRYRLLAFVIVGRHVRRRRRAARQPDGVPVARDHALDPLGRDHDDGDPGRRAAP